MARLQRVQQHLPITDITLWTKTGDVYSLTAPGVNAMRSWTTHKDTSGTAGRFVLNLTAVRDRQGRTWAEKIGAMDYLEIRAGDTHRTAPLPIIMRGFVDSVQESIGFDSKGVPTRTITVAGQDWTKLLNIWQVQYLWPVDPITAALALTTPMPVALSVAWDISWNLSSMASFISSIRDKVVNKVWQAVHAIYPTLPELTYRVALPPQAQVAIPYVENFTGSFWNLLTYYQSPPFAEMFVLDTDNGTDLIYRLAPYYTLEGGKPDLWDASRLGSTALEGPVTVSEDFLSNIQTGHSDADVYTYYLSTPDSSITQTLQIAPFISAGAQAGVTTGIIPNASAPKGPQNPIYLIGDIPLYGFRPLSVQTPWLGASIAQGADITNVQQDAAQLTWWLYQVFKSNQYFSSGTIALHGNESLRVGRYLHVQKHGYTAQYYIQSVDNNFVYAEPGAPLGTWSATLGVSRGAAAV